jgi:hypothetical protein
MPTIASNWDKVLEGTINQVKQEFNMLPEEHQAEIARRRTICASCPFNSSNAVSEVGYVHNRIDEHCILCGCTLSRKTASLDSNCGIDCCNANSIDNCTCKNKGLKDFNKLYNINTDLKWKAFKKTKNE